jgi:RHS repeat-associated protein
MKGLQKVQSKFCAQSGTWTYTNDVLGNRLTKAPAGLSAAASIYSWDILNRMTSYRSSGSQNVNTYKYRADGLRVKKTVPGSTIKSTFYRYDGQMSIEEYSVGSNHLVNGITRNTLGARGIDMIQRTTATVNETSYPLYDAHGNMTAQLLKNGASFTVANEKSYDAWGGVRAGNSNPEYKGRYCASIGHIQDDESGLIYMRARYYEPSSGRFVSEDTAKDDSNWYVYCRCNPTNAVDFSGKNPVIVAAGIGFAIGFIIAGLQMYIISVAAGDKPDVVLKKTIAAAFIGGIAGGCATFGIGAAMLAGTIGNFLQSVATDLCNGNGWAGVNWKKAALAGGIGGTLGLAFGAIGASYGRNLQVTDELLELTTGLGGAVGDFTGNAVGNAFGNAFFP